MSEQSQGGFRTGFDANRHIPTTRNQMPIISGYSLPELCRSFSADVIHLLHSITIGVDPSHLDDDGLPVPMKYATKDRIRAGVEILNRGFGRPLDHAKMKEVDRTTGKTLEVIPTAELQAMIDSELALPDDT